MTKDAPAGTIGVCPVTGTVKKVIETKTNDSKSSRFLGWLSDCALYIYCETRSKDDAEFIFEGVGAVDKRKVRFTLPASSLAEPRKFKAAVINAFGARNRVGELNFESVQQISLNPKLMKRVEVPAWDGNIPLLPGLELADNVEFRLSSKIPAGVYDGDLDEAKAVLRKAMQINKSAPLLIATILGAPVFGRWFKSERFGLGIWGWTNTLKTSTICALMSMWGTGYMDGPTLKSGRAGTTTYAATIIFASAGWLPQILDNVKTVDARDAIDYVATMNAVLEGSSKSQGNKDGGLRESMDFTCTPIVTGEIRPQETATTSRVPAIQWSGANAGILREVQMSVATLPIIGYKWLMHLATVKDIDRVEFNKYQAMKLAEFVQAGHTVAGINELMVGNPGLFMDVNCTKREMGAAIGKMMPEGVWLMPIETLNELSRIKTFTQVPNIGSMTEALDREGLLIPTKDGKKKYQVSMNGAKVRRWYVKLSTTAKKTVPPIVPPGTTPSEQKPTEADLQQTKAKEANFKTLIICASCGSDITNKTQLTKNGKTYCQPCGLGDKKEKDCGSCPVALKGDRSAIKCDPCIFLGKATA